MLNSNPKISVVMATYNGEKYIKPAIDSILNQTFSDFEFLIVDDCSSDLTSVILDQYQNQDLRVKVITNSQNLKQTKSLNRALEVASGRYIARMDDDDIADLGRLEKQFQFMEQNPDLALCGSLGWVIDENGQRIQDKNLAVGRERIKQRLLFNNQFIHSSLFIRKEILDREGFYNEKFVKAQDYELVLRLAGKYPVDNLSDRLIHWRLDMNSMSWNNKAQQKFAIKARWWAITKYGYPKLPGIGHIVLRLIWLWVPKSIKMKRFKI